MKRLLLLALLPLAVLFLLGRAPVPAQALESPPCLRYASIGFCKSYSLATTLSVTPQYVSAGQPVSASFQTQVSRQGFAPALASPYPSFNFHVYCDASQVMSANGQTTTGLGNDFPVGYPLPGGQNASYLVTPPAPGTPAGANSSSCSYTSPLTQYLGVVVEWNQSSYTQGIFQ